MPSLRNPRAAGWVSLCWTLNWVHLSPALLPRVFMTLSFSTWCKFRVWLHSCDSKYNFQRRMSRLEQRWRAQRSVISIVNCRIPWTNRDLNVYCAFGLFLKACLLQCLLIFMPLTHANCSLTWCSHGCVFVCQGVRPWRIQYTGSVSNKQLNKHFQCLFRCAVVDALPAPAHSYLLSFKTWS